MSSMPVAEPMTAQEYLARPCDPAERGWQLIGGELIDMHDPLLPHELVCKEVMYELEGWTRAQPGRGLVIRSIDVLVSERDVYGPDVLWYRQDRIPPRDAGRPYPVPDLAVEVRSPSIWRYDIGAKTSGYERAGLAELWLFDTAADEILVFRRSRPDAPQFDLALELTRDEALTSPLLAGFSVAVGAIFG